MGVERPTRTLIKPTKPSPSSVAFVKKKEDRKEFRAYLGRLELLREYQGYRGPSRVHLLGGLKDRPLTQQYLTEHID